MVGDIQVCTVFEYSCETFRGLVNLAKQFTFASEIRRDIDSVRNVGVYWVIVAAKLPRDATKCG